MESPISLLHSGKKKISLIHNLLIFLQLLLLACTGRVSSAPQCPNCGTTRVPYPLSTGPTCGDQSYMIQCDARSSKLMFPTLNNTYPIISITPSNQRLVISPSSLLPNTCVAADHSSHGIQLNSSLPFNITSSNTVMYFNCTDTLLQSPLNCSSSSPCHAYSARVGGGGTCAHARLCCSFRAGGSSTSYMIRVRETGCMAYTTFVGLDPDQPVGRWPDPGVEIQWALPLEPVCASQADCGSGGATCGPDNSSSSERLRRCFCNTGLLWDPVTGTCVTGKYVTCQGPGSCGGQASSRTALIAGLTSSLAASLFLLVVSTFLYKHQRRIKEAREHLKRQREEILSSSGNRTAKLFTGKEIKRATNNFSSERLLGIGGYGEVYKGFLDDGTTVAVKCAKVGNTKGTDQVLNEVRILSQVNHRSLVQLLGCCVKLERPVMVYEYIQNGSLFDHLHKIGGEGHLSWADRLRIAHDTAKGLAYLHFSAVPPIYHRDVKSSNILLDENLNAKVSDFGLSRLAETGLSHISTCVQGTFGYLDPEYYKRYQLTDKSDVYSFGVVLLELLTGERAIDLSRWEDDISLVVYVQRMVEEQKLFDVIDPVLGQGASQLELDTMKALMFLALSCLEEKRQDRPSMKEVVEEIDYIMGIVATPKKSRD